MKISELDFVFKLNRLTCRRGHKIMLNTVKPDSYLRGFNIATKTINVALFNITTAMISVF